MQNPNDQFTQGNPNEPIIHQMPYNQQVNDQNSSQPLYQKPQQVQYNQNFQVNQFFILPQEQNNSQNIINNGQNNAMNQYFLLPEENIDKYIDGNKLIIPNNRLIWLLYIIILISDVFTIIVIPSFHKIHASIILTIEMIILLHYGNNKIILTKDESQRKLYVKKLNLLCRTTQSYDYNLDNVDINVDLRVVNVI